MINLKAGNTIIITDGGYIGYSLYGLVKVNKDCDLVGDSWQLRLKELIDNGSLSIIDCQEVNLEYEEIKDGNRTIKQFIERRRVDER